VSYSEPVVALLYSVVALMRWLASGFLINSTYVAVSRIQRATSGLLVYCSNDCVFLPNVPEALLMSFVELKIAMVKFEKRHV